MSPWWWWGFNSFGYNPWYFDDIQPVQTVSDVEYESMPEQERVVYVQQQSEQVQDAVDKLNVGLQQQADAIVSLADQLNQLESYVGAQHQQVQNPPAVQTSSELGTNLAADADAIRALAQIAQEDQQKLGVQFGTVDLQGIDLSRAASPNSAQEANSYREIARNQARALNQIADVVVRLQHQVGIVPEGVEELQGMQQEAQSQVAVQ